MGAFLLMTICTCLSLVKADTREDRIIPPVRALENPCRKESGVTDEIFDRAMENDYEINDRKLQCYMHCVLRDRNGLLPDGKLNFDLVMNQIPEYRKPIVRDHVAHCTQEANNSGATDPCAYAMVLYSCIGASLGDLFSFH